MQKDEGKLGVETSPTSVHEDVIRKLVACKLIKTKARNWADILVVTSTSSSSRGSTLVS